MVYPALLPLMRLPVVDLTDVPADLNGLVRFAERRNLVFVRVPSHFDWPLLSFELASRHASDTQNFDMVPKFLKHMWIPAQWGYRTGLRRHHVRNPICTSSSRSGSTGT